MTWKNVCCVFLFTFLALGLALGANFIKTKAAITGVDPQITSLISPDNGQTWLPATAPVCVQPGQTVQVQTRAWNTGTETSRITSGTGTLVGNENVQSSTLTDPDCDNDGNKYSADPLTHGFTFNYLSSLGTAYSGDQCATTTIIPRPEAPCGSVIRGTVVLTKYDDTKDTYPGQPAFIGRALAAVTNITALVQTVPTIVVNGNNCPETCDGHGKVVKSSSSTAVTTLPQTGYSF